MKAIVVGLVLTVVLLAGGSWIAWRRGAVDGKPPTHLRCSQCEQEYPYDPTKDGKPCPRCGLGSSKLVAAVGSKSEKSGSGSQSPGSIFVVVIITLVLVQLAIYGWIRWNRARNLAIANEVTQTVVCHCPFCKRKIGFPRKEEGTTALCPRCRTAFTLPMNCPQDD